MINQIFTHKFNPGKLLFGLLGLACILSAGTVLGQSTTWLSPSANTGSGEGVVTPENAYSSNDAYAIFDLNTDNVVYSGFTINIPAGKVVKGVEMLVEGHKLPMSARNFKLSLSWDGGASYAGPKITTGIPESVLFGDGTVVVGSPSDNWGWSPTIFTNFRVKVGVTSGWDYTDAIYLDLLQVRITYGDPNSQLFNSSSSFTVPANVYNITVQAWGGGGAGGGSTTAPFLNYRAGAGGGGGAYASKVLSVTPGATLSLIVGAAVSGSSGAAGANGNPSYVNGYQDQIYAAGGSGGTVNNSGGSPAGGLGGSAANSKGEIVTSGGAGGNGASGGSVTSGAGGAGANGGGVGGTGVSSGSNTFGANGNPGSAPGGGGSGSVSDGFTQTGGGGAAGRIIITWVECNTPAPTGDAAQTICNSGTLANLDVTGNTVKWYAAASGGTALDESTPLVNGTTYYASQTISCCESASRLAVTVTINSPAAPTGQTSQTICREGTLTNLVVTGSIIKWYAAAGGGQVLPSSTTLIDGTTYYASQTEGGCESVNRLAVNVTLNIPVAPSGDAIQTFCNSATVANLSPAGTDIKWYDKEGALLSNETSLNNETVYFASQTIDGCEGKDLLKVTAIITTPLPPTGSNAQTFCNSATVADLKTDAGGIVGILGPVEVIKWYDVATGGTELLPTTPLENGKTYYAAQAIGNCESVSRLAVTVTINKPEPPMGPEQQIFCNSATVNNLQPDGTNIKWYNVPAGGMALDASTPLVEGATYYASQTIELCESIDRLAVEAIIMTPGAPTGQSIQTFCNSAELEQIEVSGSHIHWYDVNNVFLDRHTQIVNGQTYYATQGSDNCQSVNKFAVTTMINVTPNPTGNTTQTFCNSAKVNDLVASGEGMILWYDEYGTVLSSDLPLTSGATYYASQVMNECESAGRLAVTVTIIKPDPPTGLTEQTFCNSAKVSELQPGGSSIHWYNAASGGSLLSLDDALVDGKVYYAAQVVGDCESIDRFAVTVKINAPSKPDGITLQTFCNSATVGDLQPKNEGNGITVVSLINWYDVASGGKPLDVSTSLVSGTTYYATQTISGCESVDRLAVTVTISTPLINGTLNVCAGSTRQLTGSGTAATLNPWTSSDETVATVNSTGLVNGLKAGIVTITYTNSFGCTAQQSFTVKALPVPTFEVAPTSPGATGSGIWFRTQSGKSNYTWTITGSPYVPGTCGYNKSGGTPSSYSAIITWREEGSKTVTVNYTENGCTGAAPATITFDVCYPVSITTQPVSRTYQYNCEVPALTSDAVYKMCFLGATISVPDGISYQWYSNTVNSFAGGTLIGGATQKSYTPPANGVGDYYYYAVATRNCQKDTTDIAHYRVDPAPVEPVDAIFLYKGPTEVWTSGPTSNVASVPLLVHIKNEAGLCGDIATARVGFYLKSGTVDLTPIPGATNLPVNYIDPNNPAKGGAASALVQFNIGNSPSELLDIVIKVTGNYKGSDEFTVTIARPTPGGLICGGVFLCNTNSTGFIKGATIWNLLPTVSALNFYVAYNKSLKNPQGKVTLFVPSYNKPDGTVDKVLHWYMIRSNAISSLVVNKPTASFISKANVAEWTLDPNTLLITETLLEGNCKLVMDMTDGSPDKVGITVYRNKGGIWYANNWVGGKTEQQGICAGSLTVTGVASGPLTRTVTDPAIGAAEPFDVTVQSNPTSDRFILNVRGSLERVDIRVMDINGKVVEVRNHLTPGSPVYLGANYIAGIYMAEVIQGPNRKMIKLVKQ